MYNRDNASRFQAADIDKDRELSLGEFVLFKNPLRDENVKTVVLERAAPNSKFSRLLETLCNLNLTFCKLNLTRILP